MKFTDAYEKLDEGHKIRRRVWDAGVYWRKTDRGQIVQGKNGDRPEDIVRNRPIIVIPITETKAEDWEIVRDLTFSQALEKAKFGELIARRGWNGTGMAVAYRKGYEDIPCNRPHAEAWGIPVGESIKVRPYLQIRCADGYYQMWTASQTDILAEDWFVTR